MLPWLSLRQDMTVDFREPQVFRGTSLDWPGQASPPSQHLAPCGWSLPLQPAQRRPCSPKTAHLIKEFCL